ncbi:MAG: 2-dehydropantoate 2-reductase [Phototrophicales bacterium]|nr:MAG: 2-dehydropantoate 2-reductase [Phototrophicales bacterium]RMG74922.1 MAG: 2-dehydropantoate 2-reductase [Chloroflexota bacterium]
MMSESILIEGIGGIGGVVAARMILHGYDPILVTNNPEITTAINTNGLQITTPEGAATVPAQAYTYLTDLPSDAQFDVAYLIMKATGVLDAVRQTIPLLKPEGYVVTFQNGIVEDAVAEIIGKERVVSGIIGWGGTMHAPGVYEKTSIGTTHIGELDGQITDRLRTLEKAMATSAKVVVTTNIRGALWSKLAINCTITTIGALTGDTLGVMLQDKRMRRAFLRAYSEVIDTAEASGVTLERIATNPKLLYVPPNAGQLTWWIKDLLVRFVGRKYGKLKSSSLQSLERGRKTEIDYLNGYVVEQAKRVNVPTPVNAALVQMIKQIEAGERPIQRANLDDLLNALD